MYPLRYRESFMNECICMVNRFLILVTFATLCSRTMAFDDDCLNYFSQDCLNEYFSKFLKPPAAWAGRTALGAQNDSPSKRHRLLDFSFQIIDNTLWTRTRMDDWIFFWTVDEWFVHSAKRKFTSLEEFKSIRKSKVVITLYRNITLFIM